MIGQLITFLSLQKKVGGLKDKVISLFKQIHQNKQCMGEERNQANQKQKTISRR